MLHIASVYTEYGKICGGRIKKYANYTVDDVFHLAALRTCSCSGLYLPDVLSGFNPSESGQLSHVMTF